MQKYLRKQGSFKKSIDLLIFRSPLLLIIFNLEFVFSVYLVLIMVGIPLEAAVRLF